MRIYKISMDNERFSLNGDTIHRENDNSVVLELIKTKTEILLKHKYPVFVEGVNLKEEWRRWIVELGEKYDVPVYCVLFPIDLGLSIERNIERENKDERSVPIDVLYKMVCLYEKPDESEKIIIVTPEYKDYPENVLIFTVGLPGCGKTTLFETLKKHNEV